MTTTDASRGPGEAEPSAPGSPYAHADARALEAIARLLGHLLLHELDRSMWEELQGPDVRDAVAAIGLELPADPDREALDVLAAEYLRTFLQPESGGPLVQSLWTEGTYEGQAATAVRQLAESTGITFDKQAARGAPQDHLGSLLLLWATLSEHLPDHARHLVQHHLPWALAPLRQLGQGQGYCASVARATEGFVAQLVADVGE